MTQRLRLQSPLRRHRLRTSATLTMIRTPRLMMTRRPASRMRSRRSMLSCTGWRITKSWVRAATTSLAKLQWNRWRLAGRHHLSSAPNSAISSVSERKSSPLRLKRVLGVSARRPREPRPPALRLASRQRFVFSRNRLRWISLALGRRAPPRNRRREVFGQRGPWRRGWRRPRSAWGNIFFKVAVVERPHLSCPPVWMVA